MSWSYNTALSDTKDQVRLLIGDTTSTDQQLQDEEINFYLSTEANVYMAAAACATALATKYVRKADKQVGDLKISWKGTAQSYTDMAKSLRNKGRTHQVPSAGGISVSDSEAAENNTGLRHNAIRRGMHDYVAPSPLPNTEGS